MTIYELNIKPEYLLAIEVAPMSEEITRQELPFNIDDQHETSIRKGLLAIMN